MSLLAPPPPDDASLARPIVHVTPYGDLPSNPVWAVRIGPDGEPMSVHACIKSAIAAARTLAAARFATVVVVGQANSDPLPEMYLG